MVYPTSSLQLMLFWESAINTLYNEKDLHHVSVAGISHREDSWQCTCC